MGSTTGTGHSVAVHRARQAAARRIEALHVQEAAITATLVGYFEAKDRADKIRADAQARAARLLQAAEEKAARLIEQARAAGQELTEQAQKHAAADDAQVGEAVRLSDCAVVASGRPGGLRISGGAGWCFGLRYFL